MDDDDKLALGRFLSNARKSAGLSMAAAAKRALISTPYVHAVEHGKRVPTLLVLSRLAVAIGADPVRAVELHKAVKEAENLDKGLRLLASADDGNPAGVAFYNSLINHILGKLPPTWLIEYARNMGDDADPRVVIDDIMNAWGRELRK